MLNTPVEAATTTTTAAMATWHFQLLNYSLAFVSIYLFPDLTSF